MNLLKKYILPLLALALLVGGLKSVRSFLMKNLVEPIALVLWAAWRIVASVDQMVYWILLIVVCFLLVIRLVPSGSDTKLNAAYTYSYKSGNRVEYWKALIANAHLGKEDTENLRDGMKKLLISVMRDSEKEDVVDLKKRVAAGTLPLSSEAQDFLYPPKQLSRKSSVSPRLKELFRSVAWFHRGPEKVHPASRSIDEILKWLEIEMEISNDK